MRIIAQGTKVSAEENRNHMSNKTICFREEISITIKETRLCAQ